MHNTVHVSRVWDTSNIHCTAILNAYDTIGGLKCTCKICFLKPTGLLNYLDSEDDVPDDDVDRLHSRDNLKLAQVLNEDDKVLIQILTPLSMSSMLIIYFSRGYAYCHILFLFYDNKSSYYLKDHVLPVVCAWKACACWYDCIVFDIYNCKKKFFPTLWSLVAH